jgi:hypothetical protein
LCSCVNGHDRAARADLDLKQPLVSAPHRSVRSVVMELAPAFALVHRHPPPAHHQLGGGAEKPGHHEPACRLRDERHCRERNAVPDAVTQPNERASGESRVRNEEETGPRTIPSSCAPTPRYQHIARHVRDSALAVEFGREWISRPRGARLLASDDYVAVRCFTTSA